MILIYLHQKLNLLKNQKIFTLPKINSSHSLLINLTPRLNLSGFFFLSFAKFITFYPFFIILKNIEKKNKNKSDFYF
jgi:hypothetical protein